MDYQTTSKRREIIRTDDFDVQLSYYIKELLAKGTYTSLPDDFLDFQPKDFKYDPKGKDPAYFVYDAVALVIALKTGGTIQVSTKKGKNIGEYLQDRVNCKCKWSPESKTIGHYFENERKFVIEMPLLDDNESDKELSDCTNIMSLKDNSSLSIFKEQFVKENPVVCDFLASEEFLTLKRDQYKAEYSPLDMIKIGHDLDDPDGKNHQFYLDMFKWLDYFLGVNEKILDVDLTGVVKDSPGTKLICNSEAPAYIEKIKDYLWGDSKNTILSKMTDFNLINSKDKYWKSKHLKGYLVDYLGKSIPLYDILIGRRFYNKGDKRYLTEKIANGHINAIKEFIEEDIPLPEKELNWVLDSIVIKNKDGIILNKDIFSEIEIPRQNKWSLTTDSDLKNVWYDLIKESADLAKDSFKSSVEKIYSSLFEVGFVRQPAGVLYYDEEVKQPFIITKAPANDQEIYFLQNTRRLTSLSDLNNIKNEELVVCTAQEPEDRTLFTLYSKGSLCKEALTILSKADMDADVSINETCKNCSPNIETSLASSLEDITNVLYNNYINNPKKPTYFPMLMSEFAYGLEYKNGKYQATGLGWSEYKQYISKKIVTLYRHLQYRNLLRVARKEFKVDATVDLQMLTEIASKEGIFTDAEKKAVFKEKADKDWNAFRKYVDKSVSLCVILRVHDRTDRGLTGTDLVQYRVRISDSIGVLKVSNRRNLATTYMYLQLHSNGDSQDDWRILEEENVTPPNLKDTVTIIETGSLFKEKFVEGLPVFAYKEAQLNAKNGYYPIWDKMILGRMFDGKPILNSEDTFLSKMWHYIIAGSRSGKGVMCLTHLASAALNGRSIIYLDNKPDMYATLLSLLCCGERNIDLENIPLLNGGTYDSRYDKPITRDIQKTKPFDDRFMTNVLLKYSDNGSVTGLKDNEGDLLIPKYAYPFFNGSAGDKDINYQPPKWKIKSGLGTAAYFRLYLLLLGLVYYQFTNTGASLLDNYGGVCVFVDEFSEFMTDFKLFCNGLGCRIMMDCKKAKTLLDKEILTARQTNNKLSEKNRASDDEVIQQATETYFKTHKEAIGPLNAYSDLFFTTIMRSLLEVSQLQVMGAESMTSDLAKPMDMYIIGQRPNLVAFKPDEMTLDKLMGGIRYGSFAGVGLQGSSIPQDKYKEYLISLHAIAKGKGADVCWGYNKDYPYILAQNSKKSKAFTKLTSQARYFGYMPSIDMLNQMPLFATANTSANADKMLEFANANSSEIIYFKPYLILNDNAHTYTDQLVKNLEDPEVCGLKKYPVFTEFGDEKTRNVLSKGTEVVLEPKLLHTEKQQSAHKDKNGHIKDDYIVAEFDDGVGLTGYMDHICSIMQKEVAEKGIKWKVPEDGLTALQDSFIKGGQLLNDIVKMMHYPGTWLQFICDMRPLWMFTPFDVAKAMRGSESESEVKCLGIRKALGYTVEKNWIEEHYPEEADGYVEQEYNDLTVSDIENQMTNTTNNNFSNDNRTDEEIRHDLEEAFNDQQYQQQESTTFEPQNNQLPSSSEYLEENKPIDKKDQVTKSEATAVQNELINKTNNNKTPAEKEKDIFNVSLGIALAQYPEIFRESAYKMLGQKKVYNEAQKAIKQPAINFKPSTPDTPSKKMFAKFRTDYNTLVEPQRITEKHTIEPEVGKEKSVTGKMLRVPITQIVLHEIGDDWGNLTSFAVTKEEEIAVNGKRIRSTVSADCDAYIHPDTANMLEDGKIARWFDYRYLLDHAKNLEDIVFGDLRFTNEYIAPELGMKHGLNIERLFRKIPKLQKVYLEDRCYTRKDYVKQCTIDYKNNDYMGDMCNNFKYTTLSWRNNRWEATKENLSSIPKQFSDHEFGGCFASLIKSAGNSLLAGITGIASAMASATDGVRTTRSGLQNRKQERKKNGWG